MIVVVDKCRCGGVTMAHNTWPSTAAASWCVEEQLATVDAGKWFCLCTELSF